MDYSPTVRGRRLMRELTRLRHAQGLSLETAAQRLGFSKSNLYRIENGRGRITLDHMLDLYTARSPHREPSSSSAATPAAAAGTPPAATLVIPQCG
jgi:DNA-binding XRE family transcriptional regulator